MVNANNNILLIKIIIMELLIEISLLKKLIKKFQFQH